MTDNDRELLELAAKAAGMPYHSWGCNFADMTDPASPKRWNPLTDDGDALRLAVKLHLIVQCNPNSANAGMWFPLNHINELHDDDPYAATRRAIVRAAAEIGRQR